MTYILILALIASLSVSLFLWHKNSLHKAILNGCEVSIGAVKGTGELIYGNRKTMELADSFNLNLKIGDNAARFSTDDVLEAYRQLVNGDLGKTQCERQCHTNDGKVCWGVSISRRQHVPLMGYIAVNTFFESTELLDAKNSYGTLHKDLASLSHILSHDIKTPIRTLGTYLVKIGRAVGGQDEKVDKFIERSKNNCYALDRMLSDFVRYLEVASSGVNQDDEEVDILKLVESTLEGVIGSHEELEPDMFVIKDRSLKKSIETSPFLLGNTIMNIIHNMAKYGRVSPENQGLIKIENEFPHIRLTFKDNGIGMSEEDLENATKPFYRSEVSKKNAPEGSGLGLAIVESCVVSMRAKIDIESALGRGTVVTLRIPYGRV